MYGMRATYFLCRHLAKAVVHFNYMIYDRKEQQYRLLIGDYVEPELEEGKKCKHHAVDFEAHSEKVLRQAIAKGASAKCILYCQSMMATTGDSRLCKNGGQEDSADLVNHDYLILVLEGPNGEFWIKAEKSPEGTEIHVIYPLKNVDSVRLHAVNFNHPVPMSWDLIVHLLRTESPQYNLKDANCWDFTVNTFKVVVRKQSELCTVRAEKKRLKKEHNWLEAKVAKKHISKRFRSFFGLL